MKENKGISCDAKNCMYHDASNHCTAEHIKVGCCNATISSDTKCETFKCSDNCNCM